MIEKYSKYLVIILNWNGLDDTLDCLNSIISVYENNCPPILVVDNGSDKDETAILRSKLSHPRIQYLRLKKNLGYCGGNNAGYDWAKKNGYEKLVVLNNDTVIKSTVFERLVGSLRDDVMIAGATIVDYRQGKIIQNRGFCYNHLIGTSFARDEGARVSPDDHGISEAFVSGACFAIEIKALEDEKLFDPRFFCYFEEIDLCLRLAQKDYRSVIVNDAYIFHKGEASSSKITGFSEFQMARNRLWLIRKRLAITALMINILLYFPFRILRLLFSNNRSNIKFFISGFGAGLFRSIR